MTEVVGNSLTDPTTSLVGAIDSAAASLVVAAWTSPLPSTGTFRIRIDDELIQVASVAGTTLGTLTRGIEGTAAAAHSNGAAVSIVLTAGGLAAYVSQRGGQPWTIKAIGTPDTPYAAEANDLLLASGFTVVNLPGAPPTGTQVAVALSSSTSAICNITTTDGSLINGATGFLVTSAENYPSTTFIYDGENWQVLSSQGSVIYLGPGLTYKIVGQDGYVVTISDGTVDTTGVLYAAAFAIDVWGVAPGGAEFKKTPSVAPVDGDVPNGTVYEWFDNTPGAPAARFIAKDADGTPTDGLVASLAPDFSAFINVAKPTVTGSRGGNAALASLLARLAALGLIIDGTS